MSEQSEARFVWCPHCDARYAADYECRSAPTLVDAVARCLAQIDDKFIAAADWAGEQGDRYRARAERVLRTIERYESGIRSGGLPEASRESR